jgi:hypothetical protein
MLFPVDRKFQIWNFPNFSGGLAAIPSQDNEANICQNMEPTREGWLKTLWGSRKVNSNALDGAATIDAFTGQVYNAAWCQIVATAAPKLWAFATTNFSISMPAAFTDVTPAGPPTGNKYWVFCQATDATNRQIVLACNATDGLFKWDNGASSAVFTNIGAAPASPSWVAQHMGYTLIAGANTVSASQYLDPTTWPISQAITLIGSFGDIQGIATVPGRAILICRKGLVELQGNTFDYFKNPIPVNSVIGTAFPKTISVHGAEVGFLHYSGPYIYDSGRMAVQFIGEPIKELFTSTVRDLDLSDTNRYLWRGHLTRHHYILTGPISANSNTRVTLIFDRRLNVWYEIVPPSALQAYCFTSSETNRINLSGD